MGTLVKMYWCLAWDLIVVCGLRGQRIQIAVVSPERRRLQIRFCIGQDISRYYCDTIPTTPPREADQFWYRYDVVGRWQNIHHQQSCNLTLVSKRGQTASLHDHRP